MEVVIDSKKRVASFRLGREYISNDCDLKEKVSHVPECYSEDAKALGSHDDM